MNILVTIGEYDFPNPFVRTLVCGMRHQGIDVTCSASEIWDNWETYDLINIQWPQVLLRRGMTTIEPLDLLLKSIKSAGKPIVVTCHNIRPHYSKRPLANLAYDVVYQNADLFVHMGEYSKDLFQSEYPSAEHIIIPHHVYDTIYNISSLPDRSSAMRVLGLSPTSRYILCMGAFRNDEEVEIAQRASDILKSKGITVIAPALSRVVINYHHPIMSLRSFINNKKILKAHSDIICRGEFVSDEMLPFYYAAAEFALIQRKEILNSGNVPMAMLMGKVVVGPDTGNVGPVLRNTGNPVFNPQELDTLDEALVKALNLRDEGMGLRNQRYAVANLSTNEIASRYIAEYQNLLHIS